MILELDVGNTFIKWRVLGQSREQGRLLTANLDKGALPDVWRNRFSRIRAASVAGDELNQQLSAFLQELGQPEPIFAKTVSFQAGVKNSYTEPERMGVDRWLVMLAAYDAAKGACCIVDCGSAITIDFVGSDGQHLGGYIIPGLRLMEKGLLDNTSKIIVDRASRQFDATPGKNTSAAVGNGIDLMFTALVEKVVADLSDKDAALFITGGDGELFYQLAGVGAFKPDLVLDGLSLAME